MRHPDPFDIARITAAKADPIITKYQHSAVILDRRGRVISTGRNHFAGQQVETAEGEFINKTVHAEVHALTKVNLRRLDNATIINYGRTNVAAILSRPCDNCWTILEKLGFAKVIYTVRSDLNKPLWREENF